MNDLNKWYCRNSDGYTRCYVANGYSHKFVTIQKLFDIAKADFPEISDEEFEVKTIVNSDRIKGFSCISFLAHREPPNDYFYSEEN